LHCRGASRDLHSFPTRRSSDLFLGRSLREALEVTAGRSGPGILLGAVTAAGTFYVLMATDFRGLQELGFIAGTAILLAWLSMVRSEEHTSELQSRFDLVCRLLL